MYASFNWAFTPFIGGIMANSKKKFLEQEGILNPKPERVSHPLFETLGFFDSFDLPQVRYEMIRTARVERHSVAKPANLFGFSREYFYKLERAFMARGYVALVRVNYGGGDQSSLSTKRLSTSSCIARLRNPKCQEKTFAKRSNDFTMFNARAEPSKELWKNLESQKGGIAQVSSKYWASRISTQIFLRKWRYRTGCLWKNAQG